MSCFKRSRHPFDMGVMLFCRILVNIRPNSDKAATFRDTLILLQNSARLLHIGQRIRTVTRFSDRLCAVKITRCARAV